MFTFVHPGGWDTQDVGGECGSFHHFLQHSLTLTPRVCAKSYSTWDLGLLGLMYSPHEIIINRIKPWQGGDLSRIDIDSQSR